MELHNARRFKKPPLGGVAWSADARSNSMVAAVKIEDAESAYLAGLDIAQRRDFSAWRQLVRQVMEPLSGRLNGWRKKYEGAHTMEVAKLPEMVLEAATIYSPLMAVALAGVESENPKFSNQQAMLDEFLRPMDWDASGLAVIGGVPEALVFTYQALHGATCLGAGELPLAIALSRARVARARHYDGVIVHREHQFTGWPDSFNRNCTMAWQYLAGLVDKWPWLGRIFGSAEDYRAALSAYYMALSIQELALLIAAGRYEALKNQDMSFDVPVMWMIMPPEVQQRAYRVLLKSHDQVRHVWRSLDVADTAMAAAWPRWMEHTIGWVAKVTRSGFRCESPVYSVLFEDVRPQEV